MPEVLKFVQRIRLTTLMIFLVFFQGFTNLSASDQAIRRFISNHVPVENQNWSISQNPRTGFIYFANSEGLVEFNGITSKLFRLPYGQALRSVHVSQSGLIYTGSFEEFGFWKYNSGGELSYTSLAGKTSIEKNDEIWKIYEEKGIIFFQSFTTVYRYDSSKVQAIKSPFTMLFIFPAREGFIAQVLGNGLYRFNGTNFSFIHGSESFSWKKIHAIIETGEEDYWICTETDGIFRYDGTKFTYLDSEISSYLKMHSCNAGLRLNNSICAFGTIQSGVVLTNLSGKIIDRIDYTNGLNNNTVLSLFRDRDNGLWIGLDEGANYFSVYSPGTIYSNISGTLGTIYAIIHDKGRLYLGTNHGLFVTTVNKSGEDYSFNDFEQIEGTQGQVWALEKFDGQILCGHNEGTFLLDGDKVSKISGITGGWSIRKYNDLLIEGSYTGIVFFKKGNDLRWTFRNKIRGFNEPTRHVEVDYLGYIWASHPQKGIFKLELNEALDSAISIKFFNSISGVPKKLQIHKINNQVIFTTSDSVYAYNYDKGIIFPLKKLNQSLGEFRKASQIIPYNKNAYWFVSGSKIALFEISKDFEAARKLELLQKSSDVPERELQVIQLSDNSVLVPTRQAFTIYNLSHTDLSSSFTDLRIDRLVFQGAKHKSEIFTDQEKEIAVPYSTNNLTVYFSNPGQYYIEDKRFQYKIREIDEDWHTTNQDNFTYLNLGYGSYTLLLRSETTNTEGTITFMVQRPWYLKWYTFILYGIVISGIVFISLKIFKAELRKQKQLIESEVRRTRLESELDYKSYELMLTMRYLIQKNEILTELHEQINSLKEQSSKFPVKFIKEMERIIDQGLDSQTEEWKNTMNVLKLSHEGFFRKLRETYPSLTPNDLRLSSYLRMNFTTKEIAKLLNISGRAVEISRYRLRRKLGLSHDVNLTEFLISESESNDVKVH